MDAVLTGMLWLMKEDLTEELLHELKAAYTYQHPKEDSTFETYVELRDKIGIPAGDKQKATRLLKGLTLTNSSVAPALERPMSLTDLELRLYQEQALTEVLDYVEGGGTAFNLAGAPGSGKSVMLSAILAKLNVKTLVIAHLSMLCEQLKTEIEQFTDAKVVVLDKDNMELGDINIATSQFVSRRPELWKKIKHNIGLIAVDESESSASTTTLRILQRAHAKYRIFISATFSRSVDGRTQALRDMAGHKVITLHNDALLKPTVISVRCSETFQAPANKNLYKRQQVSFYKRNESIDAKILAIVVGSLKKKRQCLIACDLTDLQERYASLIEAQGYKCGVMNGSTKKADRTKILEDYNEGRVDVLLGFGVLNAGLSIPRISTIVRVSTPSNLEKLEQLIGRARRDYDGKDGAFIIDLTFQGFNSANVNRARFYRGKHKKEGWVYAQTTWEKFKEKLNE